jgi:hypothetical protein
MKELEENFPIMDLNIHLLFLYLTENVLYSEKITQRVNLCTVHLLTKFVEKKVCL